MKSSNLYFILSFLFLFLLSSCGKKGDIFLARNNYEIAVLELSEGENLPGSYKRALEFIDKAIELDNNPNYLAFKATILLKLGEAKESGLFFDKALKRCSDSRIKSKILNDKACLIAQIGLKQKDNSKIEESLKIWKALEKDISYKTPEAALFNQAKVYILKEDYLSAKDILIKTINYSPSFIDASFYLAQVAYRLKDIDLAKKEVNKILFLSPNHKGAADLSSMLQNF